jgi:hypothetical protein
MDISMLAQKTAAFLAVFLPYLEKPGVAADQEPDEMLGDDAWEQAQEAWGKLRPRLQARREPEVQSAVKYLARRPGDAGAQATLRSYLELLFSTDPALRKEIEGMRIDGLTSQVVSSGTRSVTLGQDLMSEVVATREYTQTLKYRGNVGRKVK